MSYHLFWVKSSIRGLIMNKSKKLVKVLENIVARNEEMNEVEQAYYERNMIALRYADGWYYDDNGEDGWKRILCLDNGKMTFHIPDDFKIGNLKQIKPTWDGHTTEEKWQRVEDMRKIT